MVFPMVYYLGRLKSKRIVYDIFGGFLTHLDEIGTTVYTTINKHDEGSLCELVSKEVLVHFSMCSQRSTCMSRARTPHSKIMVCRPHLLALRPSSPPDPCFAGTLPTATTQNSGARAPQKTRANRRAPGWRSRAGPSAGQPLYAEA